MLVRVLGSSAGGGFPQVSAAGALRIETTWIHESGPDGAPHVKATGAVENRATPESLRRRHVWETSVLNDLFPVHEYRRSASAP